MVRQLPSYTKSQTDIDVIRQSILQSKDEYVAVDTETTGLSWDAGARAFGVAIAWDQQCVFLRNDRDGLDNITRLLQAIFESDKTFVYHNAEFDMHMIRESYGVEPPKKIIDTMRVAHLYHNRMSHSLKDWGEAVFGSVASYHEDVIDDYKRQYRIKDYSRIPSNMMDDYATNDVVLTKTLAELFVPTVKNNNSQLFNLEMNLIPIIYGMEKEGIRLDIERTDNLRKDMILEKRSIEDEIFEIVGKPLEISSSQKLGDYLYGRLGVPVAKTTASGRPSTAREDLENINHPIGSKVVSLVLKWRGLDKFVGTYLEPFLKKQQNGRIHPRWNACGTVTGRLSSSEPNLQNIPKDDRMRGIFIPDNHFYDMDYSQMELRIMAHVSKQRSMIDGFNNNRDLHRMTAANMFNIPFDKVTDKQRSMGKRVNFGVIYCIGPGTLAKNLESSVPAAKGFLANFWKAYPEIKRYVDNTISKGEKDGEVKTLFGRRLRVDRERPYVAVNYVVQGTAGDCMKISLYRAHKYLKENGGKIRNTVHDQMLFDDIDEKQIPEIHKIMENFSFSMPMSVDVLHSEKSWGDLVEV